MIRYIHPKAFSRSIRLIALVLTDNLIDEFDLDLLNNHKRLKILDSFESMSLPKFDNYILDLLPDLRILDFNLNPAPINSECKYLLSKDKYI